MNCATAPMNTSFGLVKTAAKSDAFNVSPIPNITMPSSVFTQLVLHVRQQRSPTKKTPLPLNKFLLRDKGVKSSAVPLLLLQ